MTFKFPDKPLISRAFKTEEGIDDVVLWDVVPIHDGEFLEIHFEEVNPLRRQGIWLRSDRGLRSNGISAPAMNIWSDNSPTPVRVECSTADGLLQLYNIWERDGKRGSQSDSSGMQIETGSNWRRYRCNDFGFRRGFRSVVFRIVFPQRK